MLNRGFTLIEMILVIFAVGMLLQGWHAFKNARLAEAAVERTVDGFVLIDEAAYAYHVEVGAWPTTLDDLRASTPPLLPGCIDGSPPPCGAGNEPLVNGVGGEYVLRSLGSSIEVETELQTQDQAAAVQRAFPLRTTIAPPPDTNTVIYTQRAAPKDQTDHQLLVWRDGSREVDQSLPFRDPVVAGDPCAGKRIGMAAMGELMECVSAQWRQVRATLPPPPPTGMPCGWSGWEFVAILQTTRFTGYGLTGTGHKAADVMGWQCTNGEVSNVRPGSCRITSPDGHNAPPTRWYTSADCTF